MVPPRIGWCVAETPTAVSPEGEVLSPRGESTQRRAQGPMVLENLLSLKTRGLTASGSGAPSADAALSRPLPPVGSRKTVCPRRKGASRGLELGAWETVLGRFQVCRRGGVWLRDPSRPGELAICRAGARPRRGARSASPPKGVGVIGGEAPYTSKGRWVGLDISPEGEVLSPRGESTQRRAQRGAGPMHFRLRRKHIGPAPSETSPIYGGQHPGVGGRGRRARSRGRPLLRRPLRPERASEKPSALVGRRLSAGVDGVGGFWGAAGRADDIFPCEERRGQAPALHVASSPRRVQVLETPWAGEGAGPCNKPGNVPACFPTLRRPPTQGALPSGTGGPSTTHGRQQAGPGRVGSRSAGKRGRQGTGLDGKGIFKDHGSLNRSLVTFCRHRKSLALRRNRSRTLRDTPPDAGRKQRGGGQAPAPRVANSPGRAGYQVRLPPLRHDRTRLVPENP